MRRASAPPRRQSEKRISRRYRVEIEATYHFDSTQNGATGIVRDISVTGAHIEHASAPIRPGTPLLLEIPFLPNGLPHKLRAVCTRATENGFAVIFPRLHRGMRSFLLSTLPRIAESDGR